MREDLQGLQISSQKVKELSGLNIELDESAAIESSEESPGFFGTFFGGIFVFWLIAFFGAKFFGTSLTYNTTTISVIGGLSLVTAISSLFEKNDKKKDKKKVSNGNKDLNKLIDEIKKFNSIVKSIDVKDQLVEAGGGKEMEVEERKNVINALSLTREDLVRGLKIERILRENRSLIEDNSSMFQNNNLSNIEALKIKEKATEASDLIGETLQVSIGVQNQINQLMQNPD